MSYPTASLTADVVLFTQRKGVVYLLLVERKNEPFKGMWAFPGGFVNASNGLDGEEPIDAAYRELKEETGIDLRSKTGLTALTAYATPGRDPRGRVVTFPFTAFTTRLPEPVAADDAAKAEWVPVFEVMSPDALAFDHFHILLEALEMWDL